jgi:microcystin degradation protein MlrC
VVEKTLENVKRKMDPTDGPFDLHGAMSAVGLQDAEGDLIKRVVR